MSSGTLGVVRALTRLFGRVGLVLTLALAAGVASIAVGGSASSDASLILGNAGEFHPVTPARVLDTRSATRINDVDRPGVKTAARGQGSTFEVTVLGRGGLPSVAQGRSVYAIAVNVTVVDPTVDGYLRMWGTGNDEGSSSTVNFVPGLTVPNTAIVAPGRDGKVSIKLVSGSPTDGRAHVLIDVVGWFSTADHPTQGSRLIPVNPTRLYDTREAPRRAPIGARQSIPLQVRGAGPVPADQNVAGVVVNLTGVNTTSSSTGTFVSALPTSPSGMPSTSNLNLNRGQVKANLAFVPVGPDGRIHLYNANGSVHLVVDVVGYLQPRNPQTRAGRVIPLASPFRVFDTRAPQFPGGQLGPGEGEDWSFAAFANDVKVPVASGGTQVVGAQSGIIGNLTATELRPRADWPSWSTVETYLTAYPTPPDRAPGRPPLVSNLNLGTGIAVPNLALLRYGGPEVGSCGRATSQQVSRSICQVRFYNNNHHVHYLFDAAAVILADE